MAVPSIKRGRNTTAKQVTGRTRSLGIPTNRGVANAPTRPLRSADDKTVRT